MTVITNSGYRISIRIPKSFRSVTPKSWLPLASPAQSGRPGRPERVRTISCAHQWCGEAYAGYILSMRWRRDLWLLRKRETVSSIKSRSLQQNKLAHDSFVRFVRQSTKQSFPQIYNWWFASSSDHYILVRFHVKIGIGWWPRPCFRTLMKIIWRCPLRGMYEHLKSSV